MSFEKFIDANSMGNFMSEDMLAQNRKMMSGMGKGEASAQIAASLEYINQNYPYLNANTQMSLAQAGASPAAIYEVARMTAMDTADNPPDQTGFMAGVGRVIKSVLDAGGWAKDRIAQGLGVVPGALELAENTVEAASDYLAPAIKPITRYGVAALEAIPESINNVAAMLFNTQDGRNMTLGGFWDSLTIATLLDNPELQGTGYLVNNAILEEQGRRARDFRGEINGQGWTVGRGAANLVFTPNSEAYRNASGIIDAVVNLMAPDPTKLVSKGARVIGRAGLAAPKLSVSDATEIKALLRVQGGLSQGLQGVSIEGRKWVDLMTKSTAPRKLVDRLVNETSATKIMDDIFEYKIDPAFADDLAQAKTTEEVLSVMTRGFTVGDTSQIADPQLFRYARNAAVSSAVERTPLKVLRGTRAFATMPAGSLVIAGDRRDRIAGIRNMLNSLRAAGGTKDEVAALGDKIIPMMRGGLSSDLEKNALEAYKETIATVMRKNRVDETVIGTVINGGDARIGKMRSYLMDRSGIEVDHGFMKALYHRFKDDFPPQFWADFHQQYSKMSGAVSIDRPLMLVELLGRVQSLPDPRQLRRLTRSPLMRRLLSDDDGLVRAGKGVGGRSLVTRSQKIDTKVVPKENRAAYNQLSDEIVDIRTRIGSSRMTPQDGRDLDDLVARRNALLVESKKRVLTGKQQRYLQAVEFAQNVIWKPLALATGGYVIRNSIDAQIRMHFGANTGLFHPWQYMQLLLGNKKNKSILGEDLMARGQAGLDALRKEERELFMQDYTRAGMDIGDVLGHYRATNNWAPVTRGMGDGLHTQGVVQMLRQISQDPLQSIIARGRAVGKTDSEIFDMFKGYVQKNPEAASELRVQALQGFPFKDVKGVKGRTLGFDLEDMDADQFDKYLETVYDTYLKGNVDVNIGGLEEMAYMAGYGRVPDLANRKEIDVSLIPRGPGQKLVHGDVVKLADGTDVVISSTSGLKVTGGKGKPIEYSGEVTITPLLEGDAFEGLFGMKEASRLINKAPIYDEATQAPGLPAMVRREIILGDSKDEGLWASLRDGYDQATNKFFTEFVDKKWAKTLERNPTWRQFYYEAIDETVGRANAESAQTLLADLRQAAAREKLSVDEFLGATKRKSIEARLEKAAASGRKNGYDLEDIDTYARISAVARTKALLYDATERNNLVDMVRVIMPFANAWKEVIGTYLTQFAADSARVYRSAQRVYTGLSEADPDQDGLGFFYEDPQTGTLMFNFPFSHSIMDIALRMSPGGGDPVNTFMNAPVKQLSQGLSVFPALGPMAQFAASEVIPRNDDFRAIREFFLPYGDKGQEIFNPTPGWIQKLAQAVDGDVNATSTVFAQTFVETLRAKSATGKYDLNDPAQYQQLVEDARADARAITAMRALSQFTGPTAGRSEFVVPTKQGDAVAGVVINLFQKLQEQDYETAVQRFLEIMGDDLTLYVGSKTRALAGGLEGSEEFGRWQDANEDLLTGQYKNVGAYFGPKGSELNFSVWTSQIKKGLRERLTFSEIVESAQNRVGSALYADARRMYGPYRTEEQSKILRDYRVYLHQEYPGFPRYVQFTTNELQNNIQSLQDLLASGRVSNEPLAQPLTDYLTRRDSVLARLNTSTLSGKAKLRERQSLQEYGQWLATQSPEFDRIWNRMLVQEVDE